MWGHVVLVLAALLSLGSPAVATANTQATALKSPDVRSSAFWVMDAKTGAQIAGRGVDEIRPIASTSKVFVALVVREKGLVLDAWTAIAQVDADRAKGGARTRLFVDEQYTNHDLLRAMLVASDNRAPSALGRAVGLSDLELIEAVNAYAKRLGLKHTHFTDTSGLNGNTSTARELAIVMREALKDPVLRAVMATAEVTVKSKTGKAVVYHNTNRSLNSDRYEVLGGKTGYTDLAGHCFVVAARIGGREVIMAFLGGVGKLTRFADFSRVATWMEQGKAGVKPAAAQTATKVAAKATAKKPAAKPKAKRKTKPKASAKRVVAKPASPSRPTTTAARAPVKGETGKRKPAARTERD